VVITAVFCCGTVSVLIFQVMCRNVGFEWEVIFALVSLAQVPCTLRVDDLLHLFQLVQNEVLL